MDDSRSTAKALGRVVAVGIARALIGLLAAGLLLFFAVGAYKA